MDQRTQHSFKQLILAALVSSVLIGIMGCRLEDKGVHALVYPKNNATEVPVNTIVEIQFPKEMGLEAADIPESLFSIHECTVTTFDYLSKGPKKDPTKPADPTKTADASDPKTSTDPAKSTTDSETSDDGITYADEVKFYFKNAKDSTGAVFNYLVIRPVTNEAPLKSNTTYCISTQDLEKKDGTVIKGYKSHFTTKKAKSFRFDSKTEGTIFADDVSPSIKDEKGSVLKKDFILIYFNTHVSPEQLKKSVTLCKGLAQEGSYVNEQCNDFKGKVIPSNVYLIEGLSTTGKDELIRGEYNLYAVTTRDGFDPAQNYKLILNMVSSGTESDATYNELEFITLPTATDRFSFERFYQDEIKNSSDQSIATKTYKQFFIGSGMSHGSNSSSDNSLASTDP